MRLVLEPIDCVVIEIFEVYSGICNRISRILISVRGSDSGNTDERVKRRRETGIRILKQAAHSAQLSSYFDLCAPSAFSMRRIFPASRESQKKTWTT